MPKISDSIKGDIINLYNTNYTNLAEIARKLNISRPTVRKILREAGLRQIKKSEIDNSHLLNNDFFSSITNEDNAYFLGLMYADGNVYLKKNNIPTISLVLQKTDKNILEKFRDKIAPAHKLYLVKSKKESQQDQYKLSFTSNIIGNQLISLGCIPAKSLKLTFPEIPQNLLHHFVRGYFDGDGCISSSKRKNGYNAFLASIASTKNFCITLKNVIASNINLKAGIYTRKSNNITSELSVGGNRQVFKFMNWLYTDSSIYLERKHQKFLELQDSLNSSA